MEKVIIYCDKNYKEDIEHILKVNNYSLEVLDNQEHALVLLNLYEYQMNLLIHLVETYIINHKISCDELSIHQCHQIHFYR